MLSQIWTQEGDVVFYSRVLQNKIEIFKEKTKTRKQIFLAIISTYGLKDNTYSEEVIDSVVTLNDLYID